MENFELNGEISLDPIFIDDYIVSYAKISGTTDGVLRIHKYFGDIGSLVQIGDKRLI
jgi:hypothetical protein